MAMSLLDLETGHRYAISQDLGADAQGCRLDARGLAEVASLLVRIRAASADLVVLNKFGRAESEGHGLRDVFAGAIEAGIPVLTTVREPYCAAWRQYHGGLASDLAPQFDVAMTWCREAIRNRRSAMSAGAEA